MSDATDGVDRARTASAWLERERAHLLREWLAAGSDEAAFMEVWEDVRAQLIAQRLDSVGGRARNRPLSQTRFSRPFTTPQAALPSNDELDAGVEAEAAVTRAPSADDAADVDAVTPPRTDPDTGN